ncbi:hypothetical protein FAVG1_12659 [Fusarium avenaceum]|nr:hypothetical protein FAVG1_12659 [Fusarium avenaceum]
MYRKIFTILVLLRNASLITSFIVEEICDDDLPFRLEPGTESSEWRCLRSSGQEFPSPGFRHLKESFYTQFTERQWIVLAPYFDPSCLAKDDPQVLMDEQIPPFTSWKPIPDGNQGGCGEVFKVHIHPGQHRFEHLSSPETPQMAFAIKREYHFIFPWAMADLHGYWRDINRKPSTAESDKDLAWLAAQCQGLAEGLSYIHRYETASFKYLIHPDSLPTATEAFIKAKGSQRKLRLFGRHGDIKPENILYFPRHDQDMRGLLKITDFGCADFSTKEEVDCKRRGSVPNSPTYRAPETDLSPDDSSITSSYDVWTLGCVYLEFLTWWLGGWMYVKDFAERRSEVDPDWYGKSYGHFKTDFFFTIFEESNGKRNAEVRKGVKEVSILRRLSTVRAELIVGCV